MSQMGAHGCKWVCMGVDACISNEESKNKAKRSTNGRAGHVFECMVTCKKHSELAGMVAVVREHQGEE